MLFLEAQQALLSVITYMKDTISDPEKHMGRFTREDKVCFICSNVLFCLPNLFHTRWVAGDISGRLPCSRKNSQLPLPNGRSSVSGLSNSERGILSIMVYIGRLFPKGVTFISFRYIKGRGICLLGL